MLLSSPSYELSSKVTNVENPSESLDSSSEEDILVLCLLGRLGNLLEADLKERASIEDLRPTGDVTVSEKRMHRSRTIMTAFLMVATLRETRHISSSFDI